MTSQRAFSSAVLAADGRAPAGLHKADRFAVYRNNAASGLIGALAVRYPAVKRLVGDEFFAGLALAFARQNPPQSPVLIGYGAAFPDFIASFGPAAGLAYLPDVARLESLWWQSYHAADAVPINAQAFASLTPEELAVLRLEFAPSAAVMISEFPVAAILDIQRHDGNMSALDLCRAEAALVFRQGTRTAIAPLAVPTARFFGALMRQRPLGDCLNDELDLPAALARLLSAQIVTRIQMP